MEDKLRAFINSLSNQRNFNNVTNQYSDDLVENKIRKSNLYIYLSEVKKINSKVLLVGEAPGYHGCRLTGIPFTSEYILLNNKIVFGEERGYKKTNELSRPEKEMTATMVWETLNKFKFNPLMWNAFPFHPYRNGILDKNRTPSVKELEIGMKFLIEIINLFQIQRIIAVGSKASISLSKMNLKYTKVYHPSHGNKQKFIDGISNLIKEL